MGTPALHFLEVILTVSHFNLDLGPQPPNLVGTCFKPPVLCGPGLGSAEVSSPGDQAFVKENTGTFFFFFLRVFYSSPPCQSHKVSQLFTLGLWWGSWR